MSDCVIRPPRPSAISSAEIGSRAFSRASSTSLRDAALALGVSADDFDRIVDPKTMVGNPRRDLGLNGKKP